MGVQAKSAREKEVAFLKANPPKQVKQRFYKCLPQTAIEVKLGQGLGYVN